MTEPEETTELLRRYAADGSDDAFLVLMRRYTDLVYGAALRRLNGDSGLAQDVVQRVFTELARRAPGLQSGAGLGGWLYRRAVHLAADLHKAECRRCRREQSSVLTMAAPAESPAEDFRPELEDAIGRLPDPDRQAVVLRFMENRPLRSVGEALGISEDAAQKRISRALDRLRRLLGGRGVTAGTAGLAVVLSRNGAAAAPADLMFRLLPAVRSGTAGLLKSGAVAFSLQAIIMKPATIAVVVLAAASVAVPFVLQHKQTDDAPPGSAGASSRSRPAEAPAALPPASKSEVPAASPTAAVAARAIPLLPGLTEAEREAAMKATRAKAEKATQERFEEKMDRLRRKLNLTPEQEEAIAAHHRAQRERMIEYMVGAAVGEADPRSFHLENYRTDVPPALRELLTDDQKILLAEHEKTRRANFLEATTNGELGALAMKLELDESAKDAVFERLMAINGEDRFADHSGIMDLKALAAQADYDISRRREAFAAILTPDQMKSWETNAAGWRRELLKTFGQRDESGAVAGNEEDKGRAG